ncbi:MAG: hypothetical protein WBV06_19730 [Acidimicrobiia bacterium]
MSENVLRGKRVLETARPPKASSEVRTCAKPGCETTLSRYNKREFCYAHAPTKFPRLRGRVIPES